MTGRLHIVIKIAPFCLAFIFIFMFHYNAEKQRFTAETTITAGDYDSHIQIVERFRSFEKYLKNTTNAVIKKALPYALKFSGKINVSQECIKNSLHLVNGLRNIKKWAFQFFDASGKIPDGLMYGSFAAIGNYRECLDIVVKSTRKKDLGEKLYQGQYCMIEAKSAITVKKPIAQKMHELPEELIEISKSDSIFAVFARNIYYTSLSGIRIGACLPTGCTKEDLNSILQLVGQINSNVNITTLRCEKKEENNFTSAVISVLIFYSVIGFLVLAGSILDIYSTDTTIVKSKAIRALLAFSLVANFRKFCSTSQSSDNVSCLNGMKFFGLTWVILGHTFLAGLGHWTHGLLKYAKYTEGFAFQAIINCMFSVETFFIIGSFLVAYLTTKHIILQKKKFNVLMYIVHRLWRLYPCYITILTVIVLTPLVNSGPFWSEATDNQLGPCYKYWWANLFFINNFYHPKEECLLHTWYITVDIQLYIISLIFLIPLIRWPKIGLYLIFLGIIAHILFSGIITYVNEFPPVMLFTLMDHEESMEFWSKMYVSPLTHLGPYAIGLLLGYFYAMNPDFKMSRRTQVLGWCIAFICSFSVLYGTRGWYIKPMPQYLAVIYASFSRVAWSIGPAWIIFCCATGYGGILNWILSWKIFTYLGRLTFTAYLIHVLPMIILYSGFKERVQIDLFMSIWIFFGAVCISYLFGFMLHLFVEIPFANLERVLLLPAKKTPETSGKENNIVHKESKEEMKCDIIILTPSVTDSSTKL